MEVKVEELNGGPALSWAVARAKGLGEGAAIVATRNHCGTGKPFEPWRNWDHGGPLLEQWGLSPYPEDNEVRCQVPGHADFCAGWVVSGPSYLVAGMRCAVMAEFGDVIDIPDEVLAHDAAQLRMR